MSLEFPDAEAHDAPWLRTACALPATDVRQHEDLLRIVFPGQPPADGQINAPHRQLTREQVLAWLAAHPVGGV